MTDKPIESEAQHDYARRCRMANAIINSDRKPAELAAGILGCTIAEAIELAERGAELARLRINKADPDGKVRRKPDHPCWTAARMHRRGMSQAEIAAEMQCQEWQAGYWIRMAAQSRTIE